MIEQNVFSIIFGIFMIFTVRDVIYSPKAASSGEVGRSGGEHLHHDPLGGVPGSLGVGSSIGTPTSTPSIRIEYCQSCGYRQAFEDISKMLLTQYGETLRVEGDLHKPGGLTSFLGNFLYFAKFAIIAMIYKDINPFTYFQLETPSIWTYMQSNKVSASLFCLFLGNTLEGGLTNTGAFEIYFNDIPVWSKIETGRMPSAPELLQAVERQMQLSYGTAFNKRRLGELVTP